MHRGALIVGIGVALALAVAPAAADHHLESQWERYVETTVLGGLSCHPQGAAFSVGGGCFDLEGDEREIGLWVDDNVQKRLAETEHNADGLLGTNTREQIGGDHVSASYAVLDGGGNVVKSGTFCDGLSTIVLPQDAARVEVDVDGAQDGTSLFGGAECPQAAYDGATEGWIHLWVESQHS